MRPKKIEDCSCNPSMGDHPPITSSSRRLEWDAAYRSKCTGRGARSRPRPGARPIGNGGGCLRGPNEPGLRVARRRTGHAVPASPEYHGDKDHSRGKERTLPSWTLRPIAGASQSVVNLISATGEPPATPTVRRVKQCISLNQSINRHRRLAVRHQGAQAKECAKIEDPPGAQRAMAGSW
jgi:hypothetical protein